MKEQWERRRPYIELDIQALTSLLEPLLPGHQVRNATRMTGGLANTLYKIDIEGLKQPLVIRLYTRDHTTCQKDVDIYHLVHGKIPVPELFYADTSGAVGGVPYAVTEFVEGTMLSQVLASNDNHTIGLVMTMVGHELAKMGAFRWQQSGFFGPSLEIAQPITINGETHEAYINECLFGKGAAQRLGEDLSQQVSTFLHTHAQLLDELAGEATLVHADFNPHNILVKQQNNSWHVAAVLDWEFAFAGPSLFDIGNMLRNEHRRPHVFASQFIAGFTAAGGRLPENWQTQIKLLDLLSLCDLLLQTKLGDVMASDLTELIQWTVSQKAP